MHLPKEYSRSTLEENHFEERAQTAAGNIITYFGFLRTCCKRKLSSDIAVCHACIFIILHVLEQPSEPSGHSCKDGQNSASPVKCARGVGCWLPEAGNEATGSSCSVPLGGPAGHKNIRL